MEESQYDRMRKDANLVRKEEYNVYLKQKVGLYEMDTTSGQTNQPAEYRTNKLAYSSAKSLLHVLFG